MKCELCKFPARAYCESDQASLCWHCDAKVHGANFLVARHSRSLLCQACQCPTPWRASGPKLGHTVSVCDTCAFGRRDESEGENYDDEEMYTDDDDECCGENQLVPWSSLTPPPPSSSSSEDNDLDLHSQHDLICSFSQKKYGADGEVTSVDSFRRLKERNTEPDLPVQFGSKSAPIFESLKTFHSGDRDKRKESNDVGVHYSASPSR
ncbi:zf-B_box domain-containing protein [Cephalotus follicularis]|uniref:Zf-B_box domain-containing protein n=1 Tax=Cephalotus follicularis TaxID=3775 RepID=A0A1Q3CKY5_CEPFO|nr:zf-B_box domain-containing protein [Cephalotus follicularis]